MPIHRRNLLKQIAAGSLAAASLPTVAMACSTSKKIAMSDTGFRHSVCRWTYNFLPLEELCTTIKNIGFNAIDLVGPKDWPVLQKHGIDSSMCNGAEIGLDKGWNDPQYHPTLVKNYTEYIDLVAKAGYKNLICFSGNRRGMSDEQGLKNCVAGLKQIMAQAEKRGVVITMELLNSRVDHKDYMCDRSAWGIELCKQLGSENFKLLYDIYHMQIDEGDIIRSINNNHQYFGHYHTAGCPGRHELDENQELFYPAIMRAIKAVGFKGYVAQEFIPVKSDKVASLRDAIKLCNV